MIEKNESKVNKTSDGAVRDDNAAGNDSVPISVLRGGNMRCIECVRQLWLVVYRVLCVELVGATSSEGFLYLQNMRVTSAKEDM